MSWGLLWVCGCVFDMVTRVRNFLYQKKILKSVSFPLPVINVGNLTVGGTGKTPHVEYLANLLKNKNIAILSRGYGRKTKGFIDTNIPQNFHKTIEKITPEIIGDEPFQYFQKYQDQKNIHIFVGEKRAIATANILLHYPETEIIILDDAFQHRAITPNLNILLTDIGRLFYKDYLLPCGRLRERRMGANRADAVVVSKCPQDFGDKKYKNERENIISNIRKYTKENTPVFFSTIVYSGLKPLFPAQEKMFEDFFFKENNTTQIKCGAVSGIAQPKIFLDYLKNNFSKTKNQPPPFELVFECIFADHHHYKNTDFEHIAHQAQLNKANMLIITEKDATKLQNQHFLSYLQGILVCVLPIEVHFFDQKAFDDFISNKISIFGKMI